MKGSALSKIIFLQCFHAVFLWVVKVTGSELIENAIAKAGSSISLSCPVANFSSVVSFEWRKQITASEFTVLSRYMVVDYPKTNKYGISAQFNLEIRDIGLEDATHYTCVLRKGGSDVPQKSVKLAVLERLTCSNITTRKPYMEDESVPLFCDLKYKGDFVPKMRWENENGHIIADVSSSSWYSMRVTRKDDGRKFRCVVQAGNFEAVCFTGPLRIFYKPEVLQVTVISEQSTDQIFEVGDSVRLNCAAKGNPPPLLHWYFKGDSNFTRLSRVPSSTYEIPRLRAYHSGIYKCEAVNTINGESFNDSKQAVLYILPPGQKEQYLSDANPSLRIVVGEKFIILASVVVGAIILIGLIIIVLLTRRSNSRNRQRKRSRAPPVSRVGLKDHDPGAYEPCLSQPAESDDGRSAYNLQESSASSELLSIKGSPRYEAINSFRSATLPRRDDTFNILNSEGCQTMGRKQMPSYYGTSHRHFGLGLPAEVNHNLLVSPSVQKPLRIKCLNSNIKSLNDNVQNRYVEKQKQQNLEVPDESDYYTTGNVSSVVSSESDNNKQNNEHQNFSEICSEVKQFNDFLKYNGSDLVLNDYSDDVSTTNASTEQEGEYKIVGYTTV